MRLLAVVLVAGILGFARSEYQIRWRTPLEPNISKEVADAAMSVFRQFQDHWFHGVYWENEMVKQAALLRSQDERLAFYLEVVKHCEDMEGNAYLTFFDLVSKDQEPLRDALVAFMGSPRFEELSERAKINVRRVHWGVEADLAAKARPLSF